MLRKKNFDKKEDGISYLASAIAAGVITKLTDLYKDAILQLAVNARNLEEARLWVAKKKKII